ncbi:site-specific DNA methylase [Thiovulum sp. ES]|nr:site-specific DNA methylase [Thiovulum sp. ES]
MSSYNIVTGKLSFEFSKILDPNKPTPTLVATDLSKLGVIDSNGIRKISIKEGLRLFGYPDDYKLDIERKKAFDLLGNTVAVPVIKAIAIELLVFEQ